jgi:hypothetical protein
MDLNEMTRLQAGQKLIGKIAKLKAQVESLNNVSHIQLVSHKEKRNSGYYAIEDNIERVVDYDIPINVTDKIPHPFAEMGYLFLNKLSLTLQEQIKDLEKKFKDL